MERVGFEPTMIVLRIALLHAVGTGWAIKSRATHEKPRFRDSIRPRRVPPRWRSGIGEITRSPSRFCGLSRRHAVIFRTIACVESLLPAHAHQSAHRCSARSPGYRTGQSFTLRRTDPQGRLCRRSSALAGAMALLPDGLSAPLAAAAQPVALLACSVQRSERRRAGSRPGSAAAHSSRA